jgi:hypothetical protein
MDLVSLFRLNLIRTEGAHDTEIILHRNSMKSV